jgi:pimeloyl-ACP methyl ester carboxylesterase
MAQFERGDVTINYEVIGSGPPVFCLAPGGMRSEIASWDNMPWNPRTALAEDFTVISMDQRNAGSSTGPVAPTDGWHTYLQDQIALLDHLEIPRCHVLGMCIGGPFITALLKAQPERFVSAVMLQPVGIDPEHPAGFKGMFDAWASDIAGDHPDVDEAAWASFRSNMWDGDFMLTASPDDLASIETPVLILMGNDEFHPESISRAAAATLPNATLIERWKEAGLVDAANFAIIDFLHAPHLA